MTPTSVHLVPSINVSVNKAKLPIYLNYMTTIAGITQNFATEGRKRENFIPCKHILVEPVLIEFLTIVNSNPGGIFKYDVSPTVAPIEVDISTEIWIWTATEK